MMRAARMLVLAACASLGCGHAATSGAADGGDETARDGGDETARDGGASDALPGPEAAPADAGASRCTITNDFITCAHETTMLADADAARPVAWSVPLGPPPAGGFPVVVFFQGSFVQGHASFAASKSDSFGRYWLTATVAALLDHGYAVLAPDALSGGSTFWETNVPPASADWSGCSDDVLVKSLFAAMANGTFGALDMSRLYAMGISSGGFMTSRMAVSYPGRFRALADHSGSYATCSAACAVPTPLPSDHPPTLFLHGDHDTVVPMSSVQPYLDALRAEGHVAELVTDANAGHEWLSAAVTAIPAWFDAHP